MESSERVTGTALHSLVAAAALIVVIAGMRAAADLIVPFLLALSIAIICLPPLAWMRAHRVPTGIAVAILFVVIVAGLSGVAAIIGNSTSNFIQELPHYQTRVQGLFDQLGALANHFGIRLSVPGLRQALKPDAVFSLLGKFFTGFGAVLSNSLLIVITVLFILFEASVLPRKLEIFAQGRQYHRSLEFFSTFVDSVRRYVILKTATSLLTGVSIGLILWFIGLRYALLWGLLAFLLNFVPYIGAVIAAIPAILLAYLQGGWGLFGETIAVYTVVYAVIGNFIEPAWYGQSLGLSTLMVFVSLILWAWVLGPVGMLLSIPLTMIIKMALEAHPDTRWIAVLIGSTPPPDHPRRGWSLPWKRR